MAAREIPALRLDVLAPADAPVLRRMAEVDEVIEGSSPMARGLRARWQRGRALRNRAYDQRSCCRIRGSGAGAFLADIPLRSGYVGESRYGLLNLLYRAKLDEREPMALHYARLSEKPGAAPSEPLPAPQLRVDPIAARATAARFGVVVRYAVFCPGAEYGPAKRWPYFVELAARMPLPVVILGTAADRESSAGIPGKNLAGETSLERRSSRSSAQSSSRTTTA